MTAALLESLLTKSAPMVVPGVSDAFGANLVEQAGFEAVYISGGALAYSLLGRPDIGLLDAGEVVDAAARVCARVSIPVIVDGDTGFGGLQNVERTVGRLATAGVAAIQIEDQTFPKRCGHLDGKSVVPTAEMLARLRAARAACGTNGPLIIARTDAIAVEGMAAAMERAEAYLEAGADALFVEAMEVRAQIAEVARRFASRVPLVLNQVEGGLTPLLEPEDYRALGFRLVLVPGGLFRAVARATEDFLRSLQDHGSTREFRNRMLNFTELNELLGTKAELSRADAYQLEIAPPMRQ